MDQELKAPAIKPDSLNVTFNPWNPHGKRTESTAEVVL